MAHSLINPGIPHLGYKIKSAAYGVKMFPNIDNLVSVKFRCATVANRTAYIGGVKYTDKDGVVHNKPDALYKSSINSFDQFVEYRNVEASLNDGDDIIALEVYADRLLQFKYGKMQIINISQDVEFLEDTFEHKGVAIDGATCKTDYGVTWVNKNGLYLYDGQQVRDLLQKSNRYVIDLDEWSNFYTVNSIVGFNPVDKEIIVVDDATNASDIYIYNIVLQSWTKATSVLGNSTISNFIIDHNNNLIFAKNDGLYQWSSDPIATSNFSFITADIDFGQPAQRKKFYKLYVSHKCTGASNVRVQYAVNGSNSWQDFQYATLGRSVASINLANPSNPSDGTYRITPSGGTGTGFAMDVTFTPNPPYIVKTIVNSGFGYTDGDVLSIPADSFGSGSGSTTVTVTVDDTTDWQTDILKPNVSTDANNIYSLRLKFDTTDTVPADFEINDISLVYRVKSVR